MDILALIQNKQKEMAAKKQRQATLKPAAGDHRYRILPGWRGGDDKQFWHDWAIHFIKSPASGDKPEAVYLCTEKTFGKPCEVCEAVKKSLGVSSDDKMTEFLKKAGSAQRYLMNVLHLTGPEPTKVQVLEVGQGVFESICELVKEYGDITHPDTGIDIKIKREGSGLDTSYSVLPSAKSQPLNKAALTALTNLDEFVSQENPTGQLKALNAIGTIIGVTAPAGPALTGRSNSPALADMSDVEDADFTPVTGSKGADIDMDDLDELDELLG